MALIVLSPDQQARLVDLRADIMNSARISGCSTAAAAFLLVGALIVITCSCLCLMLPGVDVMQHVITPIIPSCCAIVIALPLCGVAVRSQRRTSECYKLMIETMLNYLREYKIPHQKKKVRVNFILQNFLGWQPNPEKPKELLKNKVLIENQMKVLTTLKKHLGEEPQAYNPAQKKIADAIQAATDRFGDEPEKEKK